MALIRVSTPIESIMYVGFLIRKYGAKAFRNVYAETEHFDDYLYDGYEIDAIKSFGVR